MGKVSKNTYSVDLSFEQIKLPPVTDILVLGRKTPQGKYGILHSFELISPDVFELIEINEDDNPDVEAIIVNKSIISKLPKNKIVSILKDNVFPFIVRGEALKVNFNVQIYKNNITGELDES